MIDNLDIYFAIKQNSYPTVITELNSVGSNFDVQSVGEINMCLNAGVNPSKLSYGNTIKSIDNIKFAYQNNIQYYSSDDITDLIKLSDYSPGQNVYIRLDVGETTAVWPLSGKFGIPEDEVIKLLKAVKKLKLNVNIAGISFHVGSQCEDAQMWIKTLSTVLDIFKKAHKLGFDLNIINLGGGFPASYTSEIDIVQMFKTISKFITDNFGSDVKVFAEPGRFLVANAGVLVSRVIQVSERKHEKWVYVDAGIYHGLMEASQGINLPIEFLPNSPTTSRVQLAGPTCDSYDIIYKNISCPSGVKNGDFIQFKNAGQYTLSYGTKFNGIQEPSVFIIR